MHTNSLCFLCTLRPYGQCVSFSSSYFFLWLSFVSSCFSSTIFPWWWIPFRRTHSSINAPPFLVLCYVVLLCDALMWCDDVVWCGVVLCCVLCYVVVVMWCVDVLCCCEQSSGFKRRNRNPAEEVAEFKSKRGFTQKGVDDLVMLPKITEADIVDNIQKRYNYDAVYVCHEIELSWLWEHCVHCIVLYCIVLYCIAFEFVMSWITLWFADEHWTCADCCEPIQGPWAVHARVREAVPRQVQARAAASHLRTRWGDIQEHEGRQVRPVLHHQVSFLVAGWWFHWLIDRLYLLCWVTFIFLMVFS